MLSADVAARVLHLQVMVMAVSVSTRVLEQSLSNSEVVRVCINA